MLRDGETVGVVDMSEGAEERIVKLMLGPIAEEIRDVDAATTVVSGPVGLVVDAPVAADATPRSASRLAVRDLRSGARLVDVSFEVRSGEVLGVVALEGQGQDELFEGAADRRRPTAGEYSCSTASSVASAIPLTRSALGSSTSLPTGSRPCCHSVRSARTWRSPFPLACAIRSIRVSAERRVVGDAVARLRIDTRAQSEVRRMSGGNQQKVTIARWLASGFRTLLCFDPTRGIDIGTKHQIYSLLRELAADGAAVLVYTSELAEIQLVCDRVLVVFDGSVVGEMPARVADEATLLRTAHGLAADRSSAILVQPVGGHVSAAPPPSARTGGPPRADG